MRTNSADVLLGLRTRRTTKRAPGCIAAERTVARRTSVLGLGPLGDLLAKEARGRLDGLRVGDALVRRDADVVVGAVGDRPDELLHRVLEDAAVAQVEDVRGAEAADALRSEERPTLGLLERQRKQLRHRGAPRVDDDRDRQLILRRQAELLL